MTPLTVHNDTASSAQTLRTRACMDAGFSIIELIVSMVIIGILMAIAIPTFSGGKKTSYHKEAVAAAHSYQEAIEAFAADHNGRVPNRLTKAGPMNALTGRAYLRSIPESITAGRVFVDPTLRPVAQAGEAYRGSLSYVPSRRNGNVNRNYIIRIRTEWTIDDGTRGKNYCVVGNDIPASEVPCT